MTSSWTTLTTRCAHGTPSLQALLGKRARPSLAGHSYLAALCSLVISQESQQGSRSLSHGHPVACVGVHVVVLDLGTLLFSCFSRSSKIANSKSTNLCAGSLDGAPIHRHFTNSKTKTLSRDIEVSYSTSSRQLASGCFRCIQRLQCDCDCDCDSRARCAAAVRSHNTTPP